VIDAAPELLAEIPRKSGPRARSAIGVAELPRNRVVEIEFVVAYPMNKGRPAKGWAGDEN